MSDRGPQSANSHATGAAPDGRSSTSLAVHCHAVTKTYGKGDNAVPALRGVSIDVRCGELVMLVGPSGCGKTTLISVIAGVLDRDDGECLVFGEDYQKMSRDRRTKFRGRNIGFVFQAFNLIPTLSIAENAAVPLLILGEDRSSAIKKSRELLDRVGLGNRWKDRPSRLSGGQQQRVAIARALVHRPRLVVCDEPTSALDHATGQMIMRLFKELAIDKDRSLVVVTHDSRIFETADRIALMDDGHIERVIDEPGQYHGTELPASEPA
ncbi:MAG: ABC transporter ATP-binding protein [Planctomycetota bacterium]|nr:ABC transporter ATP-binding protein [Planctomycetota bacterium]